MPPKKRNAGGRGSRGSPAKGPTVASCLATLGVDDPKAAFSDAPNLDEQFKIVKRFYHKAVLREHPDKGGDREMFEEIQKAFETLKATYQSRAVSSFLEHASTAAAFVFAESTRPKTTPSWEFYKAAAEEEMPPYRVERAKTGRGHCEMSKPKVKTHRCPHVADAFLIPKDHVRVGSLDLQSGKYSRWVHLECWRVPVKVQQGLPDDLQDKDAVAAALRSMNEILFEGFGDLDDKAREDIVAHCADATKWARGRGRPKGSKNIKPAAGNTAAAAAATKPAARLASTVPPDAAHEIITLLSDDEEDEGEAKSAAASAKRKAPPMKAKPSKRPKAEAKAVAVPAPAEKKASSSRALVAQPANKPKAALTIPRPGVGLAVAGSLAGKTVVLTGIFPELGGGAGLDLGKARARAMVESFGGRVTGSVSGRTDFVLVGKEPGMKKVSEGRSQPRCALVNLQQMCGVLNSGGALPAGDSEEAKRLTADVHITSFSAGYRLKDGANGLALKASREELAFAAGVGPGGVRVGQGKKKKAPKLLPNKYA